MQGDQLEGYLLIDCTVAVPARHSLQHAAEEASVAVRLVLRTAGHSVNDSREDLQSDTMQYVCLKSFNVLHGESYKVCTVSASMSELHLNVVAHFY